MCREIINVFSSVAPETWAFATRELFIRATSASTVILGRLVSTEGVACHCPVKPTTDYHARHKTCQGFRIIIIERVDLRDEQPSVESQRRSS